MLAPLVGRWIRNVNTAPPPAAGLAAQHESRGYAERIKQELKGA
jgi:hypothetical protein